MSRGSWWQIYLRGLLDVPGLLERAVGPSDGTSNTSNDSLGLQEPSEARLGQSQASNAKKGLRAQR